MPMLDLIVGLGVVVCLLAMAVSLWGNHRCWQRILRARSRRLCILLALSGRIR